MRALYNRGLERVRRRKRITISLEHETERILQELKCQLEKREGRRWSLSKTINLVLLGGIVGSTGISIHGWSIIRSFLQCIPVELDGYIDEYVDNLLTLRQLA